MLLGRAGIGGWVSGSEDHAGWVAWVGWELGEVI